MMPVSSKGRYAARIMVRLAGGDREQPVTKNEIAAGEDMSPDYIEQIMIRLKDAGLVRSHRGRNGGFSLCRSADEITLADVLYAVEGEITCVPCVGDACMRPQTCAAYPVWEKATEALRTVFKEATIGRMARDACAPAGKNGRAGKRRQ